MATTKPLYIFLDEGGDFNFSDKGSEYFTISSFTTWRDWSEVYSKFEQQKYDLLEYGINQEKFHCCEDNPHVRNNIFNILNNYFNDSISRIDSIIAEKRKTGPALQEEKQFYSRLLGYLLRHIFEQINKTLISEVIVITDSLPINKKKGIFKKEIKAALKEKLKDTGIKFRIYHHPSNTHYGLQIIDYCNWAIFRKWEKNQNNYYNIIKKNVKSEFPVFRRGTRYYY